jgi:hypothetical protein
VLGLLLFILYINDRPCVVPGEKSRLYADNTNLFKSSKSAKERNKLTEVELNSLNHWLIVDRLHLSVEKTCYLMFYSSISACPNEIDISVEEDDIRKVSYCKYVVVIIDEDCKWTKHVDTVYKRLVKFIGNFCQLRTKLPACCVHSIYYSYVLPLILYGFEGYAHTHVTYRDKFIKLSKEILKFCRVRRMRAVSLIVISTITHCQ